VLAARELAALRSGVASHLHEVEGEVDHRGVRDPRPDTVRVGVPVQRPDRLLVEAARDEQLDVREAHRVELPPDLAEDREEVTSARGRRIEPHCGQALPQDPGRAERAELLVLERVDQRHARDPAVDHAVEPSERALLAEDQHQGVGHRADRLDPDQLGALHRRHPVAPAEERGPLDHGRDGRVHPPGAERVHGPAVGGEAASRCPGGHPAGLTQHAEQGRLQHPELEVRPGHRQHRFLRVEDRSLGQRLDRDVVSFEQGEDLVEAGEHGPGPAVRQARGPDLRDDGRVLALGV
jgi:hypothetical protein